MRRARLDRRNVHKDVCGIRSFYDVDETTCSTINYLSTYARYYGDWSTIDANWTAIRGLLSVMSAAADWGLMATLTHDFTGPVHGDMALSQYPGLVNMAYMAEKCGDRQTALRSRALAMKSQLAVSTRWELESYYGLEHDEAYGPLALSEYGPNAPKSIRVTSTYAFFSPTLFSTPKGVLMEAYLADKLTHGKRWRSHLVELERLAGKYQTPLGYPALMAKAILGMEHPKTLSRKAREVHDWVEARQMGKDKSPLRIVTWEPLRFPHNVAAIHAFDDHLFLADWGAAAYVNGSYDADRERIELQFRNTSGKPFQALLYSEKSIERAQINGQEVPQGLFHYDPSTGFCTIEIGDLPESKLVLEQGRKTAPLHPYFAPLSER